MDTAPPSDRPVDVLNRKEVYAQLFAILTNRRKDAENNLIIGLSDPDLRQVLGMDTEELQELLKEFNEHILGLGLTVVEYHYRGFVWYAMKSMYSAPIELSEEELAVLGTFIMLCEKHESQKIEAVELTDYLIQRNYFSDFKLKKLLQALQANGYLERLGKFLNFGPRSLIEFSDEARTQIAAQANDLLF